MSNPIKSRQNLTRCSVCRAHIEAGARPSTTECPFCGANLHLSRGRAWLPGRGGILAASLLAFSVTACGGGDDAATDDTTVEPTDDTSGNDQGGDDPADDQYAEDPADDNTSVAEYGMPADEYGGESEDPQPEPMYGVAP